MRILALRTNGLVLPSVHASMVRAFQSLGVDIFDLPIPQSKEEFSSLKSQAHHGIQAIFALNLGKDQNFISFVKDLQESIRIPWIIWFVDDPEGYGFPGSCQAKWTIAFCWDGELSREISMKYSGKGVSIFHLPLATDPEVFFPEKIGSSPRFPGGVFVGSIAQSNEVLEKVVQTTPDFFEDLKAIWDIYRGDLKGSAGSIARIYLQEKIGQAPGVIQTDSLCRLWIHAAVYVLGIWKRRELVSRLIGPAGGVFGDRGWAQAVGTLYQGQIAYGEEVRKVYNNSSFILDIRQPQSRTGLTQRIFDAGACARPVLVEYSPELELFFEPEDELFYFMNPEQALDLKNRYFNNCAEERMKTEKARRNILAQHTYRHRAAQLLNILRQY